LEDTAARLRLLQFRIPTRFVMPSPRNLRREADWRVSSWKYWLG